MSWLQIKKIQKDSFVPWIEKIYLDDCSIEREFDLNFSINFFDKKLNFEKKDNNENINLYFREDTLEDDQFINNFQTNPKIYFFDGDDCLIEEQRDKNYDSLESLDLENESSFSLKNFEEIKKNPYHFLKEDKLGKSNDFRDETINNIDVEKEVEKTDIIVDESKIKNKLLKLNEINNKRTLEKPSLDSSLKDSNIREFTLYEDEISKDLTNFSLLEKNTLNNNCNLDLYNDKTYIEDKLSRKVNLSISSNLDTLLSKNTSIVENKSDLEEENFDCILKPLDLPILDEIKVSQSINRSFDLGSSQDSSEFKENINGVVVKDIFQKQIDSFKHSISLHLDKFSAKILDTSSEEKSTYANNVLSREHDLYHVEPSLSTLSNFELSQRFNRWEKMLNRALGDPIISSSLEFEKEKKRIATDSHLNTADLFFKKSKDEKNTLPDNNIDKVSNSLLNDKNSITTSQESVKGTFSQEIFFEKDIVDVGMKSDVTIKESDNEVSLEVKIDDQDANKNHIKLDLYDSSFDEKSYIEERTFPIIEEFNLYDSSFDEDSIIKENFEHSKLENKHMNNVEKLEILSLEEELDLSLSSLETEYSKLIKDNTVDEKFENTVENISKYPSSIEIEKKQENYFLNDVCDGSSIDKSKAILDEERKSKILTSNRKIGMSTFSKNVKSSIKQNILFSEIDENVASITPAVELDFPYPDRDVFITYLDKKDIESLNDDISENEILERTESLELALKQFGIIGSVVDIQSGPIITRFELKLSPGIKVSKLMSLTDEIAMVLEAISVRIEAPIPGRSTVGIEIPNKVSKSVYLEKLLKENDIDNTEKRILELPLGKGISGDSIIQDLVRMPHLLIAGATGSGKSVLVNSFIISLICNKSPDELRLLLIDPKLVELSLYNDIPHLLHPVITDQKKAVLGLNWLVEEMERRYEDLVELKARDIVAYNEKIKHIQKKKKKTNRILMPYIVVLIDELGDLMMVSGKEVESSIIRISQKARAVGIHLILATQRPSVDVITALIKANCPARIALQVAQKTDSRTILDTNGAEQLVGMGDYLFKHSSILGGCLRVQAPFVDTYEIEEIVEFTKSLGKPNYIALSESRGDMNVMEDEDEILFDEALNIILDTKKASASYLQRRLRIGYNRAARVIEALESRGYIGPQVGSKQREILKTH